MAFRKALLFTFSLLIFFVFSFKPSFSFKSSLVSLDDESSLVEIADITYRYYSSLASGDFSSIASVIHRDFSIDGLVSFSNSGEALSFLEKMYSNRFSSLEFSDVVILSYKDYLKSSLYHERYSSLRSHFSMGEYVTFVPKMSVNGDFIFSGAGLVFVREGVNWYIKGMYHIENDFR